MSIIGYIPRRIDDSHADCRVADSGAYILKDEMSVVPESSVMLNEAAVCNYVASELVPYEQFTYLTSGNVSQIQNMGEVAISNAQWNYVGTMNQNVATTGTPLFGGMLIGPDTDVVATVGRVKIGSTFGGNYAAFGHYNFASSQNTVAFYQNSTGDTILNTPTGRGIYMRLNNVTGAILSSNLNFLVSTTTEPTPASRFVVKGSTASGVTDIISGQDSNGTEMFAVNTSGVAEFKGLSVAADTDVVATIGRGKIGYDGTASDAFSFSHIDKATTTGYALNAYSTGSVSLNISAGAMYFRSSNVEKTRMSTDGTWLIGTTVTNGTSLVQVKGGISCNTLMASGLPTSDPGVAGQFWASGQYAMISVG